MSRGNFDKTRRLALTTLGISLAGVALGGIGTFKSEELVSKLKEVAKPYTIDYVTVLQENGNYYAINSKGNVICVNSPTACIQEAINEVADGGVVHINRGIYVISESVVIDDAKNLVLEGEGSASLIMLKNGITATHAVMLKGIIENLVIRDLAFDGNYENVTDEGTSSRVDEELVELATANMVNNLTLLNVEVMHVRGGAGINIGNANNVKLINVHIHDNGLPTSKYACDAVHMGFVNNALVLGSIFENFTDTGVAVDSSNGIVISGNVFKNCGSQCSTFTPCCGNPSVNYRGYIFSNNVIIKSQANTLTNGGVIVGGFTTSIPPNVYDALIVGNVFIGQDDNTIGVAIAIQEGADYVNIIGNVFRNCSFGIMPYVYQLNGLVSGNLFDKCQMPYSKVPGLVIS